MKKILMAVMAVVLLASCGGSTGSGNDGDSTNVEAQSTQLIDGQEYTENGVVKLYFAPVEVKQDSTSSVTIDMIADESLPQIKNENLGKIFCDNKAVVSFKSGNEVVYTTTFTKASFESYVDPAVYEASILFRLQYMGFEGNAVKMLAIISAPHSDEEAGVIVTLAPNGGLSMVRDTQSDVPEDIGEEMGD